MSSRNPLPRSQLARIGALCCTAGLLLFGALSCEAAKINIEGLACDAAGRCAPGYECWQGSCVAIGSGRIIEAVEPSTSEESTSNGSTLEESAPNEGTSAGGAAQTSSDQSTEQSSGANASEPGSSTAETTEASTVESTEADTSGSSDIALLPELSASTSDATSGSDEQTERAGCFDASVPDSGVCTETCPPPLLLCGTSCVDPQVNPLHCGQCDLLCEAPRLGSAVCVAGTCQQLCVEGSLVCDGRCTDVTSRRQDCGACDNRCPNGTKCVDSVCQ